MAPDALSLYVLLLIALAAYTVHQCRQIRKLRQELCADEDTGKLHSQ